MGAIVAAEHGAVMSPADEETGVAIVMVRHVATGVSMKNQPGGGLLRLVPPLVPPRPSAAR